MHQLINEPPAKDYVSHQPMTENQILEKAAEIIDERFNRGGLFSSTQTSQDYLKLKLGLYEREVFAVMMLDNQHQLIEYRELFFGTINAASVYPREVVKAVLNVNAAAVIFAHNHPSGISTPSQADIAITQRLTDALALIDVSVLDHIVVGQTTTSLAEKGLM